MEPAIVGLRSRRRQRALTLQKIQHAAPAAALLLQGMATIGAEPHGFALVLGAIEIVTSALLIIGVARVVWAARRGRPSSSHADQAHGVDWIDIFAAAVLAAEALERWHTRHHIARPTILTAGVLLVLGLFHGRIMAGAERRRTLRAGDEGLYISDRPFRRFRADWNEIAAIEIGDRWATVRTRGGRARRLDLSDLENAADVRRVLEISRARVSNGGNSNTS